MKFDASPPLPFLALAERYGVAPLLTLAQEALWQATRPRDLGAETVQASPHCDIYCGAVLGGQPVGAVPGLNHRALQPGSSPGAVGRAPTLEDVARNDSARAVMYHAANHPALIDAVDLAAVDAWAMHEAFSRVQRAWDAPVGRIVRSQREHHACAVAAAYAAFCPNWWAQLANPQWEHAPLFAQVHRWVRAPVRHEQRFALAWLASLVVATDGNAQSQAALAALQSHGYFAHHLRSDNLDAATWAQLHAWVAAIAVRDVAPTASHQDDIWRIAESLTLCTRHEPYSGDSQRESIRQAVAEALGAMGGEAAVAWLAHHTDIALSARRRALAALGGVVARRAAVDGLKQLRPTQLTGFATYLVALGVEDIGASFVQLWEIANWRPHTPHKARDVHLEILEQAFALREPTVAQLVTTLALQTSDAVLHARAARLLHEAGNASDAQHALLMLRLNLPNEHDDGAQWHIIEDLKCLCVTSGPVGTAAVALLLQLQGQALAPMQRPILAALQATNLASVQRFILRLGCSPDSRASRQAQNLLLAGEASEPYHSALAAHLLKSKWQSLRYRAIPWLVHRGDTVTLQALIQQGLRDDDWSQGTLLGEVAAAFKQTNLPSVSRDFASSIVDPLLACITTDSLQTESQLRRATRAIAATAALSSHGTQVEQRRIIGALAAVAQSRHSYNDALHAAALRALAGIDTDEAFAALLHLACRSDRIWRAGQAHEFGVMATMTCCRALALQAMTSLSAHPCGGIRSRAVSALALLDPAGSAAIFWRGLHDDVLASRAASVLGLCLLEDPQAHMAAMQTFVDEPRLLPFIAGAPDIVHRMPRPLQRHLALRFGINSGWQQADEPDYMLRDHHEVRAALQQFKGV